MTQSSLYPQESQARNAILEKIRSSRHSDFDAPEIPEFPVAGDPLENFKAKLTSFDGKYKEFGSRAEALKYLGETIKATPVVLDNGEVSMQPKTVFSALPDFHGTVSAADFAEPRQANEVQIAVAQGMLGVGETGSVYVTDESLSLPAAALFSINLYLLLPKGKIVSSLQHALRVLHTPGADGTNLLSGHKYGSFYTGPSATADIEAVHVTGAQAELSLTVLLY